MVTVEEIKRYQRVPTVRKLVWLDEMRHLLFATMTAKDCVLWQAMRAKGY